MKIRILYSCLICGLKDVACEVPAREEEDVIVWLHNSMLFVRDDHGRRSPKCNSDRASDIKIPMTGANKIGGPTIV